MQVSAADNLACPIDGAALLHAGATWRCTNGHSYDVAREGYSNLLLVQHKASRDPGDSKEMVSARRRFLDAGHFAPIAAPVFELVQEAMNGSTQHGPLHLMDAGCGEGHYLERIAEQAASCPDPGELRLAGIDVSKWAVQAASRRKLPVTWLVANNAHPPFLAGSVDMVLCLFGFPVFAGFRQIQKPGGRVVLIDPGPDHLLELRKIIYPSVTRTQPPELGKAGAAGYRLVREHRLSFQVALSSAALIRDLLAMTPHGHRMPPAGREAAASIASLVVTADVVMRCLRLQ